MARSLVRSAAQFINGVLSNLSDVDPTPFENVVTAVAQDTDERESVRKVLKTMVAQKYVAQVGEGDAATYTLTPSGVAFAQNFGDL